MEGPVTIREQVIRSLRAEILGGGFASGEPLREHALARKYRVSRGPIRDALLQLTQEGLLVGKPNCGVRVGDAPDPAVRPLMVDLRRELECFAFDRLLREQDPQRRAEHLAALDRPLADHAAACHRGSLPDVVEADMRFHRAIVERAGGGDLLAVWTPIITRILLRYSRHTELSESHAEHAAIVAAARAGDRTKAGKLLSSHIQ